jgi:hypothetical protein
MTKNDYMDPAYLHEALDRAHIASSHLQMALNDHPVIIGHPDLQELLNLAVEKIEDLYQAIGQKLPE